MQTHDLIQGTPEWAAHRATHFNASDAPAMLGCSPYKTRDQLLHEMHTGLAAEVDAGTQRRFDDGHRFEALARPHAAAIVGEDLFPSVGSEGRYSASFDGLTMDESVAFEHKTLNDALRAAIRQEGGNANDFLPKAYRVQMEQQMMVSGAERVLFMATCWTGDTLDELRHCWYTPDAELRAEIIAGWDQFDLDLTAYVAPEASAPVATGRAPDSLPALLITVKGEVTASNLADFKETALAAIRGVNRELTTDQHFADAEKAVKWCSDVEDRLKAAKEHALSQTASIDSLFKVMDDINAEARQTRLDLKKIIDSRKLSLKTELLTGAQTALADHLRALNVRLGRDYMPQVTADFSGAIHGKKNFDSMRSALNSTLANAKIEASAIADKIQTNLETLRTEAGDFKFLFSDAGTIVLKAPDDLAALVKARISDHKAETARKEEETRDRIRKEEQDRLAREQTEAAKVTAPIPAPIEAPAPAAKVVSLPVKAAPAPAATPTLKLGQIGERLGFALSGDFLKTLGFEPAARDKSALLFHEADFPLICAGLVEHIQSVQARQAA